MTFLNTANFFEYYANVFALPAGRRHAIFFKKTFHDTKALSASQNLEFSFVKKIVEAVHSAAVTLHPRHEERFRPAFPKPALRFIPDSDENQSPTAHYTPHFAKGALVLALAQVMEAREIKSSVDALARKWKRTKVCAQ